MRLRQGIAASVGLLSVGLFAQTNTPDKPGNMFYGYIVVFFTGQLYVA